jgi:hypothetical protein
MNSVPLVDRSKASLVKEARNLRWELCSMEETLSTRQWWLRREVRYQELLAELRRRRGASAASG